MNEEIRALVEDITATDDEVREIANRFLAWGKLPDEDRGIIEQALRAVRIVKKIDQKKLVVRGFRSEQALPGQDVQVWLFNDEGRYLAGYGVTEREALISFRDKAIDFAWRRIESLAESAPDVSLPDKIINAFMVFYDDLGAKVNFCVYKKSTDDRWIAEVGPAENRQSHLCCYAYADNSVEAVRQLRKTLMGRIDSETKLLLQRANQARSVLTEDAASKTQDTKEDFNDNELSDG